MMKMNASEITVLNIAYSMPKGEFRTAIGLTISYVKGRYRNGDYGGLYQKRNPSGVKKTMDDDFLGKMGEWFGASFLHEQYGFPKKLPDTQVYEKRQKGWECDLPYGQEGYDDIIYPNVGVKNCVTAEFGFSFVYQDRDDIMKNPSSTEIQIYTYIPDKAKNKCQILAYGPWYKLYPLLRPLRNQCPNKKAVYFNDLFDPDESWIKV